MEFLKSIHNLLFPTKNLCYFCRQEYNNIEGFICTNCKEHLQVLNREIYLNSDSIKKTYYSLLYNRYIRELVIDFKFNKKSYLYKPFGEIMVDTILDQKITDIDLILYIPSHRRKEAIRGYNQSELLGKYISQTLNIPISYNNLIKIKSTKDQSTLNKDERQNNLKGAFKIKDKREIYEKRILLIDDIITTGSTIIETSNILMENEAKEVVALSFTSGKKL